jgi:putative DNA primase/helicase
MSNLCTLDFDPRNGSEESRLELGDLPETASVKTGGDGNHLHFSCPTPTPRCRSNVLPGIDVKCEGGYAIFPPSRHVSGRNYTWIRDEPLADVPSSMLALLHQAPRPEPSGRIVEGARNETLFRIGCSMRGSGSTKMDIAAALHEANRSRCRPPLSPSEVNAIAGSAASYPVPSQALVELQEHDLSHLTFGRLLLARHGQDLRHCHLWKKWLRWDGKCWKEDQEAIAQQLATETQEWLKQTVEQAIEEAKTGS